MSLILVIGSLHVTCPCPVICVAMMRQYEWCPSGAEHAAHASYPYM